jgi:RHS repeat-associated protein
MDYAPFGAEVERVGEPCYTSSTEVAQKFVGKERDGETAYDYFGARYFTGAQGRFTSPDPLLNSGRPWKPQSWNRYAYALNNPLRYTDPTGMWEWDSNCKKGDPACLDNRDKFRSAVNLVRDAFSKTKEGTAEYNKLKGVLNRIGTEGDGNNLRVAFSSKVSAFGETRPTLGGNIKMALNFNLLESRLPTSNGWTADDLGAARASLVTHEGTHAAEGVGAGIKWLFSGQERLNFEGRAINTESLFYRTINRYEPFGPLWNPSWLEVDRDKIEQKRREAIESMTERDYGGKPNIKY